MLSTKVKGPAYKSVLNTVRIMTTKNPIANNAAWLLRTDRYMTSIVLGLYETSEIGEKKTDKDVQKNGMIITERPEHAQETEHSKYRESK
jgi:hypothetical protein